ncbi:MBL fold metallo-hydrolase [Agromyces neolithicus]|uniref:Metallo-beta-lactamase domain-containing protein n=1 Tax=Agromyces neolithicus TaxID=269420 RepID=A0ABP4Y798_9MICO
MAVNVAIRMYNVGFGDSFLVTVRRDSAVWRMLVDCGVHSHGRVKVNGVSRPIGKIVDRIIDDLRAEAAPGEPPHLDVVVATHHHQDHISGFAEEAWAEVDVAEVWVPFVEDPGDPDAVRLRSGLDDAANRLRSLIDSTSARAVANESKDDLRLALAFAVNSSRNAIATDRLLGRGNRRFRRPPSDVLVRYLPDTEAEANTIATPIPGVTARILGPSRDPAKLKRMDPPASVAWLQLADEHRRELDAGGPLFDPMYHVPPDDVSDRLSADAIKARNSMRLAALADDADELLAASSLLERSVNNTSVFFVLDVSGTRFLFVGDSQQGAWEHVLDDQRSRELVSGVAFYKIGHHGSHNATPKSFVHEVLGDDATAMLPWGLVKAWKDSIPKHEILEALEAHHTTVVRADDPQSAPPSDRAVLTIGPDDLWSQLEFTVA